MNPLVSIIIPAYNSAVTVAATVSSALTQTYQNTEIIVVDDGSTDDTKQMLAAFGSRITVITKENGGVSSARNAGAEAARGELLAFFDADDVMFPSYVQAAVSAWENAGAGDSCVYVNAYFMSAEGVSPLRVTMSSPTPRPDHQRMAILQGNFTVAQMVIPAVAYARVRGSDEQLRAVEDWDLWMRLIFSGSLAVGVRRPHALYRWTAGSLSSDSDHMLQAEHRMFSKIREQKGLLTADEKAYLDRRLASQSPRSLRFQADDAIDSGDYRRAARLYREAASLTPRDIKLQLRRWTVGVLPPTGRMWRARQSKVARRY